MLALTRDRWSFAAVLVLVEIAGGSIDTAMNAEASHRLVGNPSALVRLHALFNTGALTGAAVAALVIHAGVSWRWIWPGDRRRGPGGRRVGPRHRPRAPPSAAPPPEGRRAQSTAHPIRRLRRDGLLVLLVVFALAEVTEGGVDTWGVLFLRNHLATGVLLGAGAYVVGQLVAATTRGAGGSLLGRLSTRHALDHRRLRGRRRHPARVALAPLGRGRARAGPRRRRRLTVLAARHEHGQPDGEPGGQRGRCLHRRRLRGLGGRGADRRLGLPDARTGPRAPGPGPGLIRGRRRAPC